MSREHPSEKQNKKQRPVIAFFNGNMYYPSYRTLIRRIYDGFACDDLDLHIYMGANLQEFFDMAFMNSLCSENHFYSVFSYAAYDLPDLIVITMGGIVKDGDENLVRELLSHFSDIPVLILENPVSHQNAHYILLENKQGIMELTEHLITVHGCRHLAYLSGPPNNNDAIQRLEAFQETLNRYGLSAAGIQYGNFTPHVEKQVNLLLDTNPDALVCANDVMAETAVRIAKSRGKKIGSDLIVTGFDDSPFSSFLDPPLTTVRQDYGLIANAVVNEVRHFLRGDEIRDVMIPAPVICRASCGCCPSPEEFFHSNRQNTSYDEQVNQIMLQSIESSAALRNMMYREQNEEDMFQELGRTLYHLGAKRSCILLHEKPVLHLCPEMTRAPEGIRMVMRQEGEQISSFPLREAPQVFHGDFRQAFPSEQPTRLTDFILFYQEQEYGVLIAEVDPANMLFFYSLSLEIGSGLRFHQLSAERRAASVALEEQNQILSYTASHDALTGLYNRAGIMNEIFSFVRSFPETDRFMLVVADLDHLKQINDCLGHNMGDVALKHVSAILRDVLPAGSPLGRNGGDEFLAVIHLENPDQDPQLREKLCKACVEVDEKEQLPFFLGISAGTAPFGSENLSTFLQTIEQADQALYLEKTRRRDNVIR